MTGEARLFGILVDGQPAFAFPRHHVMAFIAGYVGHLMRATAPVQGDLLLVALLADLIFLLRRDGFKGNGGGLFFVKIRFRNVSAHRPMAGFAGFHKGFLQFLFVIPGVFGFGEGFDVVFVAVEAGADGVG